MASRAQSLMESLNAIRSLYATRYRAAGPPIWGQKIYTTTDHNTIFHLLACTSWSYILTFVFYLYLLSRLYLCVWFSQRPSDIHILMNEYNNPSFATMFPLTKYKDTYFNSIDFSNGFVVLLSDSLHLVFCVWYPDDGLGISRNM
jgi:hypothetical protein